MHLMVEVDVNEGEDAKTAIQLAQALVEEYYKESFTKSGATVYEGNMAVPDKQIERPLSSMVAEMEVCTTLEEIKTFHLTIKNAEEQEVYNRKVIELTK